jgi:polyferredoxin
MRQRVRKAILLLSFLLFPITMNFLSPYVIIAAARVGIVNGSLIAFGLLFLSALFLGRLWCSWGCPGGAMQEIVEPLNVKPVNSKKLRWVKWLVWIPWVAIIALMVIQAGGYHSINLLYLTENGISVDQPMKYIVYYLVIGAFMLIALFAGRRAGCYTLCWMAPFLVIGRWIRNRFAWPALRLQAQPETCTSCHLCTRNCPMSLDVQTMVQTSQMENSECILCGNCIDTCKVKAIRYRFSKGNN